MHCMAMDYTTLYVIKVSQINIHIYSSMVAAIIFHCCSCCRDCNVKCIPYAFLYLWFFIIYSLNLYVWTQTAHKHTHTQGNFANEKRILCMYNQLLFNSILFTWLIIMQSEAQTKNSMEREKKKKKRGSYQVKFHKRNRS